MGDRYGLLKTRIVSYFGTLASDEEGQAVTEYILLLSMVVIGSITLSRSIMSGISQGLLTLGAVLEQDLKTGRANVSIWKN